MRNLILLIASVVFISFNGIAKEKSKTEKVEIQTSAVCETCKHILEEKLNYTKGVRFAELDMDTKKLIISYSPSKISVDELKTIISKTGYDADEVPADSTAQKSLPLCCHPENGHH